MRFNLSTEQQESLRRLGSELVILFGSHATGDARADSDVDIGIFFDPESPVRPKRYGEAYALLQMVGGNSRLDLVVLNDAAYTLQYRAAMEGQPLFEATRSSFADFRERAMHQYFDFQPLLRIHNQAMGISV
jgi:uncharacterized protein